MKIKLIFTLLLVGSISVFSYAQKSNISVGIGVENGLYFANSHLRGSINYAYKINNFWAASLGLGYINTNEPTNISTQYDISKITNQEQILNSELHLLYSPFKNNKASNFSIGLGVSNSNYWFDYPTSIEIIGSNKFEIINRQKYTNNILMADLVLAFSHKLSKHFSVGISATGKVGKDYTRWVARQELYKISDNFSAGSSLSSFGGYEVFVGDIILKVGYDF